MNTVTLTVKKQPELYLECENVNPDVFAGKKADQIAKLGAFQGKEISTLGEYFTIAGDAGATAAETNIIVNGDCTKMKYLGAKMTAGEMVVNSACDMYTGSWMKGGKLVVNGDVHSFCGLAMAGGEFHHQRQCRELSRRCLSWRLAWHERRCPSREGQCRLRCRDLHDRR